jgi:hypothetical protein
VWALDPANSRDLIDRLRPHGRKRNFDVAWVGAGWRPLVQECHERLEADFPDYELLYIKQKYGVLEYQAFPRRWAEGRQQWTTEEYADLQAITSQIRDRSGHTCEWCGSTGQLREWRKNELTLCGTCDQRFPDPPYAIHGLPRPLCQNRTGPRELAWKHKKPSAPMYPDKLGVATSGAPTSPNGRYISPVTLR